MATETYNILALSITIQVTCEGIMFIAELLTNINDNEKNKLEIHKEKC